MLSKVSQTQKATMQHPTYMWSLRGVKFIETESRVEVARPRGGRNEELIFNGYGVSLWENESFGNGMMIAQHCKCH